MTLSDAVKEINRVLGAKLCHDGNMVDNVAERGNTATTTHIVALMDLIRCGRIKSGDKVLLIVTGSGLTIGEALYTFDDLPDRLRAGRTRRTALAPTPPLLGTGRAGPLFRRAFASKASARFRHDRPTPKETIALATAAARDCLSRSAHGRQDVGLLLYAGVYRDDFLLEPAIAALLAGELGLGPAPDVKPTNGFFAFDVFNGALGFLNACHVAIQLMRSTKQKVSLVVASEIENNRAAWPERLLGLEETGSALLLSLDDRGGDGSGTSCSGTLINMPTPSSCTTATTTEGTASTWSATPASRGIFRSASRSRSLSFSRRRGGPWRTSISSSCRRYRPGSWRACGRACRSRRNAV